MKSLIVFDLDGTLALSKSPLDGEMAGLLQKLFDLQQVAVISGGDWSQFEKQVLSRLQNGEYLQKLFILPTSGTKFYRFTTGWELVYEENFSEEEKETILESLKQAVEASHLDISRIWGRQIEDRGSQITFSALGQEAPLKAKEGWDPDFLKRKKIVDRLREPLHEFSIGMGGTTSIDIVKQGIDKSYGIQKLKEVLKIPVAGMLFVGDKLMEGGNDFPVIRTGISWVAVQNPEETKRVIETIIAFCSGNKNQRS